MAENPPLNRIYVLGYSANDRDYPIVSLNADPRVAGYKVPEDLSTCPDKRYPNHVFTGAQPISGDERVRHVWEILPSPWVPFTRYDDDLGPIQGRRRSVKNEGQVASLASDKRVTYEAREGSAIVYTELEESWSIKVDEDGNSLFPIKDRDFYDPSRGPVQERRQLFVPTGEEEASLENVDGVITQIGYEPYNEFLSVKITQTYKVAGPQLISKATNESGQLVTISTQRKGSDGYVSPNPTATRTVETSSEDKESLVERIVDTPSVFANKSFRKTRDDLTPQKFRGAQEDTTIELTLEGIAEPPVLATGEFAKSEQQVTEFVKRISTTSRVTSTTVVLFEKVLTSNGQIGSRVLTLASGDQSFVPSATLIDANVEALGDGRTVKTEVTVPNVFPNESRTVDRDDIVPAKFRSATPVSSVEISTAGTIQTPVLNAGQLSKSEQQVTEFIKRTRTVSRDVSATKTITSKEFTSDLGGGYAQIIETYPFQGTIPTDPDFGTISDSIEDIGDGTFVRRKSVLPTPLPVLRGQEYDDALDFEIPYIQYVEEQSINAGGPRKRIQPRDIKHSNVTEYRLEDIAQTLDDYYITLPDMAEVSLPDNLISVTAVSEQSVGESEGSGFGDTYFFTKSKNSTISGSIVYDIEQGYRGVVPAERAVFFLKREEATAQNVLAKTQNVIGFYPTIKQQSHEVTVMSRSISESENNSVSFDSGSTSTSKSASYSINQVTIPPTLHGEILIKNNPDTELEPETFVFPTKLNATTPTKLTAGRYLYRINSAPYRFGYIRIEALIIDIRPEYLTV